MTVEALRTAYNDLSALVNSLDEAASWKPTTCVGWTVRDLVQHLLADAQRALVALGTPARGPADKDAVTYWLDSPGAPDADSRGIRATRTIASQWHLDYLAATYCETAAAVVTLAGRAAPDDLVATQGHVLSVDDLLDTLLVEAAIHHLDMTVELEDQGPCPELIAVTRRSLDGLLGRATPADWDAEQWVQAATGRGDLTAEQREYLGRDIDRLPLIR
jgi:Mycothiol maleylpyruvate isomerase N-terminal domain